MLWVTLTPPGLSLDGNAVRTGGDIHAQPPVPWISFPSPVRTGGDIHATISHRGEYPRPVANTTHFFSFTSPHRGDTHAPISHRRGYPRPVASTTNFVSITSPHRVGYPRLLRHRSSIPSQSTFITLWYHWGACWFSCEFDIIFVLHRGYPRLPLASIIWVCRNESCM